MFVATAARCMARRLKAALKPPVDPKIPSEDAQTVSRVLYDIIRERGPLTVAETWDHSKVVIAYTNVGCHSTTGILQYCIIR